MYVTKGDQFRPSRISIHSFLIFFIQWLSHINIPQRHRAHTRKRFSTQLQNIYIYHCRYAKYVTEVCATGVILRDVRKVREIIGILAGAMNVTDLVFANWFLSYWIIIEKIMIHFYMFVLRHFSAREKRVLR